MTWNSKLLRHQGPFRLGGFLRLTLMYTTGPLSVSLRKDGASLFRLRGFLRRTLPYTAGPPSVSPEKRWYSGASESIKFCYYVSKIPHQVQGPGCQYLKLRDGGQFLLFSSSTHSSSPLELIVQNDWAQQALHSYVWVCVISMCTITQLCNFRSISTTTMILNLRNLLSQQHSKVEWWTVIHSLTLAPSLAALLVSWERLAGRTRNETRPHEE